MKPITADKTYAKKNGYQSDDDNVRYKLNAQYFNNAIKSPPKPSKKPQPVSVNTDNDDNVRYKFPTVLNKPKPVQKIKPKQKIKVNFWSTKPSAAKSREPDVNKDKITRRHTIGTVKDSPKPKAPIVKVRKRVSFLPSPLFNENHVPMVTVPDDLTIQLNEEEANDLGADLNLGFVNSDIGSPYNSKKGKSRTSTTQTSPRGSKRKHSSDDTGYGNEHDLEFFSKYVVQKLRRMETNQRIYSENLINSVLMLGQLGQLNGKSKIQCDNIY